MDCMVLVCYQIIDTQVAQRGRQYHRNPPYKKKKKPSHTATPHHTTPPTLLQKKDKMYENASKKQIKEK
jgi:hypothetical protein